MFEFIGSNDNPSLLERFISIFWSPKYESPVPRWINDANESTPARRTSSRGVNRNFPRPRNHKPSNLPKIKWLSECRDAGKWLIVYAKPNGEMTTREVEIMRTGYGEWGDEYFDALDGGKAKTFKRERVISMERIP